MLDTVKTIFRPDVDFDDIPVGNILELGFNFVNPSDADLEVYNRLSGCYQSFSEMSEQDRIFLSTLVSQNKPQKVLELGVSHGASSVVILNALKENPSSRLYSLDYNEYHYRVKGKKTGYFVEGFPDLKKNWSLHTGGFALNFLDKIASTEIESEKFDMCLIDTVHSSPGEILDFLQVLPYLKKNAIVIFHDTNLQLYLDGNLGRVNYDVNNILMSSINGEKLIPSPYPKKSALGYFFNNIGAVRLKDVNLYNIFNLLSQKWYYMPPERDLNDFKFFLERFYDKYYCKYFEQIIEMQKYLNDFIRYSK